MISLEVRTKIVTELQFIAEAFADHFSLVFVSSCPPKASNYFDQTCSDFLNVPYIYDSNVKRAVSHLRSKKSVGPDEIPNFIIKGSSHILFLSCTTFFSLLSKNESGRMKSPACLSVCVCVPH
jgi:hypothetical protein